MENVILFAILVGLIVVLIKATTVTEKSLVYISKKFKINGFILGFAILGVITSLPEISIAIFSSNEAPQLSLGNLIGATIVLLTLVIGLAAVKFKNLEFRKKFREKEVLTGIVILLMMVVFNVDKYLSVIESIILLGSYIFYVFFLNRKLRVHHRHPVHKKEDTKIPSKKVVNIVFKIMLSLIMLIFSAYFIVQVAEKLATNLNLPHAFIGIFVLGLGTNLPEITILIISKTKNENVLALGNFFGSACINAAVMGVLGILSGGVLIPSNEFWALAPSAIILVITLIVFSTFSWTGKKLDQKEGMMLVVLYIILILTELVIVR